MNDLPNFSIKRGSLYALIVSVGLGALLGILAILSGRFGWFEVRILLTTVTVASASICALACGAYLATKRGRELPIAGIALTGLAAVLILSGMWMTITSEAHWKLAATSSVYAVALAHLSLLSMARLANWFQWSIVAARVVILGVATIIVAMILGEVDSAGMFQLLGVAAIIDAAISLVIPILHRLSRAEVATGDSRDSRRAAIDAELESLHRRIDELEQARAELA